MSEAPAPAAPSAPNSSPTSSPAAAPANATDAKSVDTAKKQPAPNEQLPANEELKDTKPAARKFKVKIDDQEQEVDEAEVLRGYQKAKAADKRFREAKAREQQIIQFLESGKQDPTVILSKLGINPVEFAESLLIAKLQEEALSPEARELKATKKKLEEHEAREKAEAEAKALKTQQAMEEHYRGSYEKQIIEELPKSGLPRSEHTVREIARYLELGLRQGIELTVKDVIPVVRADILQATRDVYGGMDESNLLELLGSDIARKIQKADLARLKQSQTAQAKAPAQGGERREGTPKKHTNVYDWRDQVRKKLQE